MDADTAAISVSDLSELVAGLDFTVDASIYDYDGLNLKELTILVPGSSYISPLFCSYHRNEVKAGKLSLYLKSR